jgi:hypothetical protein
MTYCICGQVYPTSESFTRHADECSFWLRETLHDLREEMEMIEVWKEIVKEFTLSGREEEDNRLGYVVLQVDRELFARALRLIHQEEEASNGS